MFLSLAKPVVVVLEAYLFACSFLGKVGFDIAVAIALFSSDLELIFSGFYYFSLEP